MSNELWKSHIRRLKVGSSYTDNLLMIPEWLKENTSLNGKAWTFKDHEWQIGPLTSKMPEQVIIKPSQIGASELSIRLALARVAIMKGYTLIYVLPSSKFAQTFAKTRADSVIEQSSYLSNSVSKSLNSSEVKKFNESSYLYFKGAQVGAQSISIPASCIVADETCFCDQGILSSYTSRLTHSLHRHRVSLSTPTLPDFAIHEDFQDSRRHYRMYKCSHCTSWHWFDFFNDVRVPDAPDFNFRNITPALLARYPQYTKAVIVCPSCGKEPDLGPDYREWVVENPDYTGKRDGFHASPVDVPKYNTPAYMIEAATRYSLQTDWMNNTLGLPAQSNDSTLSEDDMRRCIIEGMPGTTHSYVMGLDLGLDSYCVIAAVLPDSTLIVVHIETIPISRLVERRLELEREYRCRVSVVDSQPYVESVHRMQKTSPNLFAAVYVKMKSIDTHAVRNREVDKEKGAMDLRMVNINRDRSFDVLMEAVKAGEILKVHDENDQLWVSHAVDMKRVKTFDRDNELCVTWVKSKAGNDHAWHATLYAYTASRILGVARFAQGGSLPLISSFKLLPQNP
jgi:hypothetical protein